MFSKNFSLYNLFSCFRNNTIQKTNSEQDELNETYYNGILTCTERDKSEEKCDDIFCVNLFDFCTFNDNNKINRVRFNNNYLLE